MSLGWRRRSLCWPPPGPYTQVQGSLWIPRRRRRRRRRSTGRRTRPRSRRWIARRRSSPTMTSLGRGPASRRRSLCWRSARRPSRDAERCIRGLGVSADSRWRWWTRIRCRRWGSVVAPSALTARPSRAAGCSCLVPAVSSAPARTSYCRRRTPPLAPPRPRRRQIPSWNHAGCELPSWPLPFSPGCRRKCSKTRERLPRQ